MKKLIVAFDIETTGLSFKNDYIVQISAVKFDSETFEKVDEFDTYVIPPVQSWEIAEGAFSKHGLTKEFIYENGIPLKAAAETFLSFLGDCDTLSHNGKNFDVRMISKDFKLVGLELNLDRVFFDSYLLETMLHPRHLENIYESYTGQKMEGAHNSLCDVYATVEVFRHQVELFKQQQMSLDDIMNLDESKLVCIDGMIKKDGDKILFAKGKHKDTEFMKVCEIDSDYVRWFMNNPEFDSLTKKTLKEYYAEKRKNIQ